MYKKGCPADCDNYRPISLVSILYKVYASILLSRLKSGGAEQRLWRRQFGFRSRRSTEDALFIVRRRVEQAWAARNGHAFILALDWRKAFDCISVPKLLHALSRFGVPTAMVEAVADIYRNRQFKVEDGGHLSSARPQCAGISQGCPLSPFLFGILMSALMTDAQAQLSTCSQAALSNGYLEDILYADDTLIIGRVGAHVKEYMKAIEQCGHECGLKIHWGKVQLVKVRTNEELTGPDGQILSDKQSMIYLGSTVHADGRFRADVGRKLGAATADFQALVAVWKNAGISSFRKLEIFDAVVVSKLLYSTSSAWLTKGDLRKLDGFHARCLRRILKIQPSYISRVSNDRVRALAKKPPFSELVRRSQLTLLGGVLLDPGKKELRAATFHGDTMMAETHAWVRRRGRPRHEWTSQLLAVVRKAAGNHGLTDVTSMAQWSVLVDKAIRPATVRM